MAAPPLIQQKKKSPLPFLFLSQCMMVVVMVAFSSVCPVVLLPVMVTKEDSCGCASHDRYSRVRTSAHTEPNFTVRFSFRSACRHFSCPASVSWSTCNTADNISFSTSMFIVLGTSSTVESVVCVASCHSVMSSLSAHRM